MRTKSPLPSENVENVSVTDCALDGCRTQKQHCEFE